ncbi:Cyclic nucleotide-gated cation channel beta-1, partial [Ophiophagus hannah]
MHECQSCSPVIILHARSFGCQSDYLKHLRNALLSPTPFLLATKTTKGLFLVGRKDIFEAQQAERQMELRMQMFHTQIAFNSALSSPSLLEPTPGKARNVSSSALIESQPSKRTHGALAWLSGNDGFMLLRREATDGNSSRRGTDFEPRRHFLTRRRVNPWNDLPSEVVGTPTLEAFKKRLDNPFKTSKVPSTSYYSMILFQPNTPTWAERAAALIAPQEECCILGAGRQMEVFAKRSWILCKGLIQLNHRGASSAGIAQCPPPLGQGWRLFYATFHNGLQRLHNALNRDPPQQLNKQDLCRISGAQNCKDNRVEFQAPSHQIVFTGAFLKRAVFSPRVCLLAPFQSWCSAGHFKPAGSVDGEETCPRTTTGPADQLLQSSNTQTPVVPFSRMNEGAEDPLKEGRKKGQSDGERKEGGRKETKRRKEEGTKRWGKEGGREEGRRDKEWKGRKGQRDGERKEEGRKERQRVEGGKEGRLMRSTKLISKPCFGQAGSSDIDQTMDSQKEAGGHPNPAGLQVQSFNLRPAPLKHSFPSLEGLVVSFLLLKVLFQLARMETNLSLLGCCDISLEAFVKPRHSSHPGLWPQDKLDSGRQAGGILSLDKSPPLPAICCLGTAPVFCGQQLPAGHTNTQLHRLVAKALARSLCGKGKAVAGASVFLLVNSPASHASLKTLLVEKTQQRKGHRSPSSSTYIVKVDFWQVPLFLWGPNSQPWGFPDEWTPIPRIPQSQFPVLAAHNGWKADDLVGKLAVILRKDTNGLRQWLAGEFGALKSTHLKVAKLNSTGLQVAKAGCPVKINS